LRIEHLRLALAEGLLRTVTSDDQAATIAGDLLEQARRGRPRFAADLCSVFLGVACRTLIGRPLRHFGALILAALTWSVCYLSVRLTLAWAGWLPVGPGFADCLVASGMRGTLLGASLAVSGLLSGAALGLLGRNSAAAGVLPLAAVFLATAELLALFELLRGTLSWHCVITYVLLAPLCYVLPLLLGAIIGRCAGRPAVPGPA